MAGSSRLVPLAFAIAMTIGSAAFGASPPAESVGPDDHGPQSESLNSTEEQQAQDPQEVPDSDPNPVSEPSESEAEPAVPVTAGSGEIVVTARRRGESLQKVPESITVFGSEEIENARITSFRDVANLTPSVSQLDNFRPGLARIQIRGLITPQVGDPPVAIVVDGVTVVDLEFINQDLVDIERIEVLRGAQGALYGRGAIGGAVIVETRKPGSETEGYASLSYGNGSSFKASAVASGALSEGSSYFRVGGYYQSRDGFIDNEFLRDKMDYLDQGSIFGQFLFYPGDRTSIAVKGRYSQTEAGFAYYQGVTEATKEDFSIQASQNVYNEDERELLEISARVLQGFDLGTLEVSLGYSGSDGESFGDQEYSAVPSDFIYHFAGAQQEFLDIEALTAEARFTSQSDQAFRWSVGAFYQDRQRDSVFTAFDDDIGDEPLRRQYFLDNIDRLLLYSIVDEGSSEVWALSGQVNYDLSERWEITGALRYDNDTRRSVDPRYVDDTFAEETYTELQPKVSLAFDLSPGSLLYGGYSRGFRSGGFNEPAPGIERAFDKEVSDSYELGAKFSFLDGFMSLNAAVFLIDQENAQYTAFNVDTFTLENLSVDKVRTTGIEAELTYYPTNGLTLRINGNITDSDIKQFDAWPDLVGGPMVWVSDYSLTASADYTRPISNKLGVNARIAYSRVGPRIFDFAIADIASSPYDFVFLGAGLRLSRGWSVQVFADNVFNERAIEDLFLFDDGVNDLFRLPNKGRMYGVELGFNF